MAANTNPGSLIEFAEAHGTFPEDPVMIAEYEVALDAFRSMLADALPGGYEQLHRPDLYRS